MPVEEIGNLGLDGTRQKLPRTTAQNFSQRIFKCTWLGELNDIILGHGVSSFNGKWRLEHPPDTPPHLVPSSPTFAHSSLMKRRMQESKSVGLDPLNLQTYFRYMVANGIALYVCCRSDRREIYDTFLEVFDRRLAPPGDRDQRSPDAPLNRIREWASSFPILKCRGHSTDWPLARRICEVLTSGRCSPRRDIIFVFPCRFIFWWRGLLRLVFSGFGFGHLRCRHDPNGLCRN
jgi:hypothetical protein